jgi:hypothetical protein
LLCICFVLAPLDNHEIAFGYESFTAARHLRAVSLVSRHFPPLHVALCRFGSRAARGTLRSLRFARALGFACAATLRFATAHLPSVAQVP